jgi:hypothetical protein
VRTKLKELSMGLVWTHEPVVELTGESELCGVEERRRCDVQGLCTKVVATVLGKESDVELARLSRQEISEVLDKRQRAEAEPAYKRCQEIQVIAGEVREIEQSEDYKNGG